MLPRHPTLRHGGLTAQLSPARCGPPPPPPPPGAPAGLTLLAPLQPAAARAPAARGAPCGRGWHLATAADRQPAGGASAGSAQSLPSPRWLGPALAAAAAEARAVAPRFAPAHGRAQPFPPAAPCPAPAAPCPAPAAPCRAPAAALGDAAAQPPDIAQRIAAHPQHTRAPKPTVRIRAQSLRRARLRWAQAQAQRLPARCGRRSAAPTAPAAPSARDATARRPSS
jgi:hypothetical protein